MKQRKIQDYFTGKYHQTKVLTPIEQEQEIIMNNDNTITIEVDNESDKLDNNDNNKTTMKTQKRKHVEELVDQFENEINPITQQLTSPKEPSSTNETVIPLDNNKEAEKQKSNTYNPHSEPSTLKRVKSNKGTWKFMSFNAQSKYNISREEIHEIILTQEFDVITIQDCGFSDDIINQQEHNFGKYVSSYNQVINNKQYDFKIMACTPKIEKPVQISLVTIWKRNLTTSEPKIETIPNLHCIHLTFMDSKLMVINIYIPPQSSEHAKLRKRQIKHLITTTNKNTHNKFNTIIMGDLNMLANDNLDRRSNIERESPIDTSNFKSLSSNGLIDTFREIHNTKRKFSRHQVTIMTAQNSSIKKHISTRLDYILVSKNLQEDLISADILEDTVLDSDHRIITMELWMTKSIPPDTSQTNPRQVLHINQLKADKDKKEQWMNTIKYKLRECKEITQEEWNKIIIETTENIVGRIEIKKFKGTPFIRNKYVRQLKTYLNLISRTYRKLANNKAVTISTIERINKICIEYNFDMISINEQTSRSLNKLDNIRQKLRNLVTHLIRKMERDTINNKVDKILKTIKDDKFKVFKILNKRRKNPGITAVRKNKELITDPNAVKKEAVIFWESLFDIKPKGNQKPVWLTEFKKKSFSDVDIHRPITLEEVKEIIAWLKKEKSSGSDEMSNEILKLFDDEILQYLVDIMNNCLKYKQIPNNWKHSRIYPIYKGTGTEYNVENFRPIALLSVEYKIFTAIINKRLNTVIDNNNLLSKEQTGFRPNMDTSLNVNTLTNIIKHSKENNYPLHILYIDFSKAYDSVQHWAIQETLETFGFSHDTITLLMSFYENNTVDIITNHGVTDKFKSKAGVRQGDPLSPTIWVLFLDPIIQYIRENFTGYKFKHQNVTSLGYADDMTLLESNQKDLHEMFDMLKQFSDYNRLTLNPKKSAYTWNNDKKSDIEFQVNNTPLECLGKSISYKYLGNWINLLLNWNTQNEELKTTYIRTLDCVCRKYYLSNHNKVLLINALTQTVLAYRMDTMMFSDEYLDELDKITIGKLNKSCKLKANASKHVWYEAYKLNKLRNLNLARYASTQIDRNLNKTNTLASNISITARKIRSDFPEQNLLEDINKHIGQKEFKIIDSNVLAQSMKIEINYSDKNTIFQNGHTIVWTDGSFEHDQGIAAVWFNYSHPSNFSFEITNATSSSYVEAIAVEAAITILPMNITVDLIIDNQAVIDAICNWNTWSYKKKSKCPIKNIVYRILELTNNKHINLNLFHIYSHLLDNNSKLSSEEIKRRCEIVKETFQDFARTALEGNKEADKLTKEPTIKVIIPEIQITLDRFQVFHRNKLIEGNLYQAIHNRLRQWDSEKWIPKGKTTMAIVDKDTDKQHSLWPLNNPNYTKNKSLTTFKHKLITGLPTRNVMHGRHEKNPDLDTTEDVRFEDTYCTWCGPEVLENTEHIFICPSTQHIRDHTADKLIQSLEEIANIKVNTLPFWFTTTNHTTWNDYHIHGHKLKSFNQDWGNRGIIPAALHPFLKELLKGRKKEQKLPTDIMNLWTELLTKMAFETYKHRNKSLEEYTNVVTLNMDIAKQNKKRKRKSTTPQSDKNKKKMTTEMNIKPDTINISHNIENSNNMTRSTPTAAQLTNSSTRTTTVIQSSEPKRRSFTIKPKDTTGIYIKKQVTVYENQTTKTKKRTTVKSNHTMDYQANNNNKRQREEKHDRQQNIDENQNFDRGKIQKI